MENFKRKIERMNDLDEIRIIEEKQNDIFVIENYCKKDMNNFLNELEEIKKEGIFTKTNATDEYADTIGIPLFKLKLILNVLHTKKIMASPDDICLLGQYLSKLGVDIVRAGKTLKGCAYND